MSGLFHSRRPNSARRSYRDLKRSGMRYPVGQGHRLKHQSDNSFSERRKSAESARRQLIAKFESAPKPTDPVMQERLAAREAVASARTARRAERDAMKAVENDRLLREAAALAEVAEAHHRAEAEARQLEANNRVTDEAARKAERDRRYAARKARRA
ncbi:hypothetical protein AMJ96_PD00584 (plasmid) [Rhizobium sp. N113]|nr:hypothetical protein AMJ96_PD00584 [Rhizobium sp. N113]